MVKYVIQRVCLALVNVFLILSLTYILVMLLPLEKPIGQKTQQIAFCDKEVYLGYMTYSKGVPNPDLGTFVYSTDPNDGPVTYYYRVKPLEQYANWLKNILTKWEWGQSRKIEPNVDVSVIIAERVWVSMKLNIFSVIFSVPLGILLGIWAALKKNTMTDHIISTMVMIFISIPSFVLISFLVRIFGYNLQWLPAVWPNPTDPNLAKFLGYIIPVFCLSFGSVCGYCRVTRAELCEVMESDYLLLARTKGLTRKQAIVRHALKNAMVPIFPSILAEFIGLLGGSMILEKLYGINGIGSLFITALTAKDYNVLFVDMAIFTTISLLSGVVLDLSYGFIDPRIRMGAKK